MPRRTDAVRGGSRVTDRGLILFRLWNVSSMSASAPKATAPFEEHGLTFPLLYIFLMPTSHTGLLFVVPRTRYIIRSRMTKEHDNWNERKKTLDRSDRSPFYHQREIWFCAAGVNIGNEIDGKGSAYARPVLVLRAFNAETFFGAALIGNPRTGPYYFSIGKVVDREAVVNLSQLRLFDTKRLIRKIGTLNEDTFQALAKSVTLTLFPFLSLK